MNFPADVARGSCTAIMDRAGAIAMGRHRGGTLGTMRLPLVILLLVGAAGCTQTLSRQIVEPPNLKSKLRGSEASQQELADHLVSRQLRVHVGPPGASLSVWVLDPMIFNA